jgi:capsular exopolysaccharide synthesis family protein
MTEDPLEASGTIAAVTAPQDGEELKLRDYVRAVARRKVVVIVTSVVLVAASLVLSFLAPPTYRATAKVLVHPGSTSSLLDSTASQSEDPVRALATEIEILTSAPIKDAVRKQLGSAPAISATPVGQTDVIQITATARQPRRAADIADAYATAYVDFRRQQVVNDLLAASDQIQARIADLQKQIDAADGPAKQPLLLQQSTFQAKLNEIQVDRALQSNGVQLVARAPVPASPSSPKPARNAVLALGFALVLGVGLALLVDYFDDSVKTKDDVAKVAPGVPLCGLIPVVPGWKDRLQTHVIALEDPTSPVAEAYRALRTSVQLLSLDEPLHTIQITSANAGEGKTTTLVNLGVVLARAGHSVVLVCCDLRRPRLPEFFDVRSDVGLMSVLLGEASLSDAVQKVPRQNRLHVLASGRLPPNPSEILSSRRIPELLGKLRAEGHVVLVDSPPLLPVTDALVLSRWVEATLLVCEAGTTTRKALTHARELLQQGTTPLVGVILNGAPAESTYAYRYYRPEGAAGQA